MRHLRRLLELGWRVVTEVHTAWWIVVDVLVPSAPAAVIAAVLGLWGEHSVALIAFLAVVTFSAVALILLAWLGYRQESKRAVPAPMSESDVEWTIRDLFIHVCPDLDRTPDDAALRRETAGGILDALASGKLAIRGRKIDRPSSRRQPLTVIDSRFWTDVLFTFWFLDEGGSPMDVRNNKTAVEYADLRVDRASALKVWPPPIPIREAAGRAYERTRGTKMAQAAEARQGEPDGILNHYITHLFIACRIFAQKPPSTTYEEVPVAERSNMRLWRDGDMVAMGYAVQKIVVYADPRVPVQDLDAFVEDCKQAATHKMQL